jgi:hypothetical protein
MDKHEGDLDKSWDCIKVFKYSEAKVANDSVDHRCLLELNDQIDQNHGKTSLDYVLANPTVSFSLL